MEPERVLGTVAYFLVVFMVIGAGIILVLDTLAGTRQIAAAVVLGLVVASVALASALASVSESTVTNPYW